jgi:Holliday junction resolvase RusA-like endonuclease
MDGPLKFSIVGRPTAKGRARAHAFIKHGDGDPRAGVRLITPGDTVAAERLIAQTFRAKFPRHRPWTGPILLQFTAIFEIPASFTGSQRKAALDGQLYHTSKPDKDNVEKLICDALNGIAWIDDAQLQGGGIKRYGTVERIDVTLRKLDHIGNPADRRREAAAAQGKFRI